MIINSIPAAAVLNAAVGFSAWKLRAVTPDGAAAGIAVGMIIYLCGGPLFWLLLFLFFTSSSVFSVLKKKKKIPAEIYYEKTGARDWLQVAANGGASAVCSAGFYLTGSQIFAAGIAASLAAAAADTWASELGTLSKSSPVLITTFQRVEKGRSGAVSSAGTFFAFAGALFIALVYLAFSPAPHSFRTAIAAGSAGFAGALFDSILGATVQAQYICAVTGNMTEKKICNGEPAELIKGFRCINNDAVNALSTILAAALAMSASAFL